MAFKNIGNVKSTLASSLRTVGPGSPLARHSHSGSGHTPLDGNTAAKNKPSLPASLLPLEVRICSWNLHGTPIAANDDVGSWIAPGGSAASIIVVGIQELVELGAKSVMLSQAGDLARQGLLESRVEHVLASTGKEYTKLVSFGMVGLALLVYVLIDLAPYITDVDCDRVKTGLQGSGGNKGAVLVRLCVGEFSMCFVNVHLASGQNATAERSQHLMDILSDSFQGVSARGSTRPAKQGFLRQSKYRVAAHHFAVVFGDFNARLNTPEKEGFPEGTFEQWLKMDQLLLGLMPAVQGFREGPIMFPPTYKYHPGTDDLSEKRVPAWCDRVVFKAGDGAAVDLFEYGSYALRNTSDHRPIAALFTVAPMDQGVQSSSQWAQQAPARRADAMDGQPSSPPAVIPLGDSPWPRPGDTSTQSPWDGLASQQQPAQAVSGNGFAAQAQSEVEPMTPAATYQHGNGWEEVSSGDEEAEEEEDVPQLQQPPAATAAAAAAASVVPSSAVSNPWAQLQGSGDQQREVERHKEPDVATSSAPAAQQQQQQQQQEAPALPSAATSAASNPWAQLQGEEVRLLSASSPWAAASTGTSSATTNPWASEVQRAPNPWAEEATQATGASPVANPSAPNPSPPQPQAAAAAAAPPDKAKSPWD